MCLASMNNNHHYPPDVSTYIHKTLLSFTHPFLYQITRYYDVCYLLFVIYYPSVEYVF